MLKLPQRMDHINPNEEEYKKEVRKQLSSDSDMDVRRTVPQSDPFSIFSNKKHHEIRTNSGEFSSSAGANTKKLKQNTMLSGMTSSFKNIMNRLYCSNSSHGATIHVDTSFNNVHQTSPVTMSPKDVIEIHCISETVLHNSMNANTSEMSSNQRSSVITDGSNGYKFSNIFVLPIVPLEMISPSLETAKRGIGRSMDVISTHILKDDSAKRGVQRNMKINHVHNDSTKASFRSPRNIGHMSRSENKESVFSERSGQSTPSIPSDYFSHNSDYKMICKRMNPQLANLVGVSCCHSFVENNEHTTYVAPSFHGLENSPRIIPNYYLTTNMKNGLLTVDYHFTILDDIRNLRPLNPVQLKYIDENMSDEEKQNIIVEFNRVMESVCELLHRMD
jgi:hypothetical protein